MFEYIIQFEKQSNTKALEDMFDLSGELIRCRDCKHKPYRDEDGFIEPESGRCPCINDDDDYYSWIPKDDWFCGWGERREDEPDNEV